MTANKPTLDRLTRIRAAIADVEQSVTDAIDRAAADGHDMGEARRVASNRFAAVWADLDDVETLMVAATDLTN